MTRGDDQRLADILEATDEMALIVGRGKQAFAEEAVVRLAIERLLEIIGEAARALSDEARERFPQVPWRDITRLRIVLAHHYHRVDPELVWAMARGEVPALAEALRGAP